MSRAFLSSTSPSRLDILRDRGAQLGRIRAFFAQGDVCEVDTPLLSRGAALDTHIDLFATDVGDGRMRYLHSSPEFGMKRLLSEGMGDMYQLCHVYRLGECSAKHQPEFTLLEWYRVGVSFTDFIEETIELLRLVLGPLPTNHLTYREAFKRYTQLDLLHASDADLFLFLENQGVQSYSTALSDDSLRDDLLNQILGLFIEPHLGWREEDWEKETPALTILSHYPASQAALARTTMQDGEAVAERFEVYCQGIELANGYHELTDAEEQARRFQETNQHRLKLGKQLLPIDALFLEALKKGLPDCCGVAVGFDRLMMLRHQKASITDVIPFSWDET